VLSETAARALFGSAAQAVGRFISQKNSFDVHESWEVAGVARDVRFAKPSDPFGFLIYVSMEQAPAPITQVILRTSGDPAEAAANLRSALLALDPARAIGAIRPLDDTIDQQLTQERLLARIAACFGLLALVLTAIGVYGVITYAVELRTREMGIRLALGATRAQVTAGLMREVALLLIAGALPGAIGALALTRLMRTLLFGAPDYSLLAAALAALCLIAALAAYLPARRAAQLDPATTLRY